MRHTKTGPVSVQLASYGGSNYRADIKTGIVRDVENSVSMRLADFCKQAFAEGYGIGDVAELLHRAARIADRANPD